MVRRGETSERDPVTRLVKPRVRVLDKREPVRHALGAITDRRDLYPIVADHGAPYGIVTARGFMRRSMDADARIEKHAHATGKIDEETTVQEAARVLAERHAPFMPVTRSGHLAGAVRAVDIAAAIRPEGAAESVTHVVPLLAESDTIGAAIHHFTTTHSPILPVIDASGRVVAILQDRDLLPAIFGAERRPAGHLDFSMAEHESILDLPIKSFTVAQFSRVAPQADMADVQEGLEAYGSVVVASDTDVRGVITPLDLLRGTQPGEPTATELRIVPKRGPSAERLR